MQGEAHQAQCRERKKRKPNENPVDEYLHQTMRDPQDHIAPGQLQVQTIARAEQRMRQRDGIEDRWLFQQVIIVICNPGGANLALGNQIGAKAGAIAANEPGAVNPRPRHRR